MADKTITDPLGRAVMLHDRTWFGHILKGHRDVAKLRHLVESAIRQPAEIRHSASDPDCRLYFARIPRRKLLMMVVVDVVKKLVKTAHLAKKPSGGKIEWSKPTR